MPPLAGVTSTDLAKFQLKIMMANQYDRVLGASTEKDIIIACLRVAWNDAFRHVSKNHFDGNGANKKFVMEKLYPNATNNAKQCKRDAIADLDLDNALQNSRNSADVFGLIVNEYICQKILGSDVVYNTFVEYASKPTTREKMDVITNAIQHGQIRNAFAKIKVIDDDEYPLCFGHLQKLFNMATKWYLCVFMMKNDVGITAPMGEIVTEQMLQNADCPVDSIILGKLDSFECRPENICTAQGTPIDSFGDIKWSKIGKFDVLQPTTEPAFGADCYAEIQRCIGNYMRHNHPGKSNLYFDFLNWI